MGLHITEVMITSQLATNKDLQKCMKMINGEILLNSILASCHKKFFRSSAKNQKIFDHLFSRLAPISCPIQ